MRECVLEVIKIHLDFNGKFFISFILNNLILIWVYSHKKIYNVNMNLLTHTHLYFRKKILTSYTFFVYLTNLKLYNLLAYSF